MQFQQPTSCSSQERKWISIGPPEIRTRVYTFAFLPGKPHELIVGTRPDGFFKVNVIDKSWHGIDVDCQFTLGIGPNQHGIAISPHDGNLLFLGIEQHGILKSTDGGTHWIYANTGLRGKDTLALNGICFCFHPKDNQVIFYGSDGGIYRSSDSGQTWRYLQQGLPPLRRNPQTDGKYDAPSVWQLGTHGAFPERVYASFFCTPPDVSAGMYISNDAGDSWHPCSAGLPEGKFSDRNDHKGVIDFAISDIHPEMIFAGLRKGLFKTHNGGVSWHSCGPFTMPIRAICLHPHNADLVYIGLDDGSVHFSADSGANWSDISQGLPVNIKTERVTVHFRNYDGTIEERTEYRWKSFIWKIGINPEMPEDLYAATPFGLFRRKIS